MLIVLGLINNNVGDGELRAEHHALYIEDSPYHYVPVSIVAGDLFCTSLAPKVSCHSSLLQLQKIW